MMLLASGRAQAGTRKSVARRDPVRTAKAAAPLMVPSLPTNAKSSGASRGAGLKMGAACSAATESESRLSSGWRGHSVSTVELA
jgi:hypothetical protein